MVEWSEHLHISTLQCWKHQRHGQQLYVRRTGKQISAQGREQFWRNLPLLSHAITVYSSPEWSVPVHTKIYLIAGTASGASGPLMAAGQLCPSAGLTGSVSDTHFAVLLGQHDDVERIS